MSGRTLPHATISGNQYLSIGRQLAGGRCRVFTADMAIKTPILLPYRYPDLSIVCGRPIIDKIGGMTTLINPILIVEL
jgi:Uma2 family endonuclease